MNLRPPGYEHYDSRPRRLKPSPLTHTIPSQRVHRASTSGPPGCPGYTFGYTLPTTAAVAVPLTNIVVVPSFADVRWLHIDRPRITPGLVQFEQLLVVVGRTSPSYWPAPCRASEQPGRHVVRREIGAAAGNR